MSCLHLQFTDFANIKSYEASIRDGGKPVHVVFNKYQYRKLEARGVTHSPLIITLNIYSPADPWIFNLKTT